MLELKDICWSTPDGRQILNNISLTVSDGRMVAVSGPNGGGKTTLAKIIMGIEKPSSGRIIFNGTDITEMSVTERARLGISFGFQQPVRFKGITVLKLLRLAAGSDLPKENAAAYLREVGLCAKDYIDRDIDGTLSGGEIKRIEIASVLARNSQLMVFDEPEAGIDLWSFKNLIDVFEKLRNERNRALVIISHQERILRTADEIIIVSGGKVAAQGPSAEMMEKMTRSGCTVQKLCGKAEVYYEA